jgi:membrane associated rhomboid family serine protease
VFLPIGDSPNPRTTPWVTYALMALNIGVFLALWPLAWRAPDPSDPVLAEYVRALVDSGRIPSREALAATVQQLSVYDLVVFRLGFRPAAPSIADMFTGMFLHGGLAHLAGNMLFLWIYGDNVEHRLGRLGYLAVYLGTGLAAAAGDGLIRWGSEIPAVGASGAISGVLGCYFVWFPHNRVRVLILFFFIIDVIEFPARLVLGFYLVVDNLLPLALGAMGGVAYGAHIGGFVAGTALAYAVARRAGRREDDLHPRRARPERPAPASPEAFRAALAEGRLADALELLLTRPLPVTRATLPLGDKLALARALAAAGHAHAALRVYRRLLAEHPEAGPARAEAHLGAAELQLRQLGMETAAYQHLYEVLESGAGPAQQARAQQLLADLARRTSSLPRPRRRRPAP